MRKYGLIASIAGCGILGVDLLLRALVNFDYWLWLPGALGVAGGAALLVGSRGAAASPRRARTGCAAAGGETARLLDNFEQRFAELKGRKTSASVLAELYALGAQLEQRGRVTQATAVFRHLARADNTYRDVSSRLKRLMDDGRARPKPVAPPPPVLRPPPPLSGAAVPLRQDDPPRLDDTGSELERLGRYQLEREIGRGAMGIVYLGRDTAINRLVAIKAIPLAAEFSDSELVEARTRFFREAETAGRLNHPNIVTIYDVGEERGLAYIAMEYLKGRHLSEYASPTRCWSPARCSR